MTKGITTKALLARRLLKFYALRDRYLTDKYSPVRIAQIEDRIVKLQLRIKGS